MPIEDDNNRDFNILIRNLSILQGCKCGKKKKKNRYSFNGSAASKHSGHMKLQYSSCASIDILGTEMLVIVVVVVVV